MSGQLSDLLKVYLDRRGPRIRPGTRRLTEQVWRQMIGITGDIEVDAFGQEQAEDVIDWFLGQGLRSATVRSYTKTLRPVFRWWTRRAPGYRDPWADLDPIRVARGEVITCSDTEVDSILAIADPLWQARIYLAYTAGLRRGEALNLTIADIDVDRQRIHIRAKTDTSYTWSWTSKDHDYRQVPLTDQAQRALLAVMAELPEGQPYVCLTPERYDYLKHQHSQGRMTDRMHVCPDDQFDDRFARMTTLVDLVGMKYKHLRSTCITRWIEKGLLPHEVQRLAGHSSVETTMTYYVAIRGDIVTRALTLGATGLEPATSRPPVL